MKNCRGTPLNMEIIQVKRHLVDKNTIETLRYEACLSKLVVKPMI